MSEPLSPWAEIVGPCFTVASFARATGMIEKDVRAAAADLSILALTTLDGVQILPSFQVRDGRIVPRLRPILETLRGGIDDPWTWAQWLNIDMPDKDRHIDEIWAGEFTLTLTEARHTAWAWAQ
ncbi:hypothetical protein [Microbacterium enclense]|uniref:Uncharacterized protein n=1 Tax=Microbacterium enclense TaxID=993073 RepID=A0A1G6ICA4_9MICO|nr:hypothetical protein [Microbacterium enclense]KSU55010.1 hypothetical protein AS029_06055 [Microbacterium enclense]SDC04124.1 hypothetical protein SAMN05216418_1468 [Microbacterium enclense]